MKKVYYFFLMVVLLFSVYYPLQAAMDFHPEYHHMISSEQTKEASIFSKTKRLGSQIVKSVKSKLSDLPLFGRGNMSRGRKALLFIGIGLLAFILPWFIWADLLASGLALALAFLVGPVLFLIGGVLGTIGVVKGDEHPVEAMVAMVLGVLPFVLIIVWFLFNF